MNDELIVGGISSYTNFGATVKSRTIHNPEKKSIKETVPFSNVTYDFSAINGEVYWNERKLEYELEMLADTPEALEEMKIALAGWLMNVISEEIQDPFIKDYHFIGTYDSMDFDDDESVEKTTAKVVFSAYPYKVANVAKEYTIAVPTKGEAELTLENNSSHRIVPTLMTDADLTVVFDNVTYTVPSGTSKDSILMLPQGKSVWKLKNDTLADCNAKISFFEEVF